MKREYITPISPDLLEKAGRILGSLEVCQVARTLREQGKVTIEYPTYLYTWVRTEE
jgi:hypothetical protein